jgi:integrase
MQNLKQHRRANKTKLVYVTAELIGDLRRYARDVRIRQTGYLFGAQHYDGPISRQYAGRLINRYAEAVEVLLPQRDGTLGPATARDFRHGAAVNQMRQGVPLSEVAQQYGQRGSKPPRSTPDWRMPSDALWQTQSGGDPFSPPVTVTAKHYLYNH